MTLKLHSFCGAAMRFLKSHRRLLRRCGSGLPGTPPHFAERMCPICNAIILQQTPQRSAFAPKFF